MTTANVLVNHSETVQTSSSMAKGVPGTATARAVAWPIARTFIIVGLLAAVLGLAPAFVGAQAFALDDSAILKTAPGDLATQAEGEGAGGGEAGDPLASGTCGESATWTLSSEGLLSIQGEGSMTDWASNNAVPWYAHRDKVVSVEIGDGITSIGSRAFRSLTKLANVSIAASVATIGASAFQGCTALKGLSFSDASEMGSFENKAFGAKAFDGCNALEAVNSTSKNVYVYFRDHSGLQVEQQLPAYDPEKLLYAYDEGARGIWIIGLSEPTQQNLRIPVNLEGALGTLPVVGIAQSAFYNETGLRGISFDTPSESSPAIRHIEAAAFKGCVSLTSITVPASVESMGNEAFSDCYELATVDFAQGAILNVIGERAFFNCGKIERLELPGTVSSIGVKAFSYATPFSAVDTVAFPGDSALKVVTQDMFHGCKRVELGEKTEEIDDKGFYNCPDLVSVKLPSTLTKIGNSSFQGCRSLESIQVPAAVSTVGSQAFYGCSKLASATFDLPSSLKSIGASAFRNCSSLTAIALANNTSLQTIGASAFYGCSKLAEAALPAGLSDIGNQLFYSCQSLESFQVPAGVASIGNEAFYHCAKLASIQIPDARCTAIGDKAFEGCASLESVVIPPTVSTIGARAFYHCTALGVLTILADEIPAAESGLPAEVVSINTIGDSAFEGCTKIASVTLPASLSSIGQYAFKGCSALEIVKLQSDYAWLGYQCFMGIADPSSVYVASDSMLEQLVNNEGFLDKSTTDAIEIGGSKHDISDANEVDTIVITVEDTVYGSVEGPKVTVTFNGMALTEKTDYTLSYEAAPEVGECTVVVKGEGDYVGFARKNYHVNQAIVDAPVPAADLKYNGAAQVGVEPSANNRYKVTGNTATDAGAHIAKLVLIDKKNYKWADGTTDDKTVEWSIAPIGIVATPENAVKTYGDGNPRFEINLTAKAASDQELVDKNKSKILGKLTAAAESGADAGSYTISISGKTDQGNFVLEFGTATLTIEKRDLSSASISLGRSNYIYDGQAAEPSVSVRVAGKKLEAGKDYTLEYADNTEVGTAKVLVTGIGNYRGVADKSFTISRAAVTVTPVAASKEYGDADPVFTAKVTGVPAGHESDIVYALSRAGGEKIGSYTITAAGASAQGNYTVRFGTARLTISQKSISDATVSFAKACYPYTGAFVKPAPVVKLAGKALKAGVDYTVSYSSNINDGTAQATVRGMGGYAGSAVGSFKIAGIPAGKTAVVAGATYKAKTNSTVVFKKAPVAQAKVRVPAKVVIHGKRYKVVGIAPKAFKGTATKTVIVKSKALTKAKVRKCLKGSQVKTLKVPAAKKNAYKKIFAKKNAGKKVKVK